MKSTVAPSLKRRWLLLLALGLIACGEVVEESADAVRAGVTVRDSAGIMIYTTVPPATPETWVIRADPSVRIGSLDGDEAELFSWVHSASFADDGDILIVDGRTNEIRRFDRSGQHVLTLGGEGDGPGEFPIAPFAVGRPTGGTLAWDPQRYRFVEFDTAGRFVAESPARRFLTDYSLLPVPSADVWQINAEAQALWTGLEIESVRNRPVDVFERFLLVDAAGGETVDLGRHQVATRVSFGDRSFRYPFAPAASAALGHAEYGVAIGDASVRRVTIVSSSGRPDRVLDLAVPRTLLTEELVAQELDSLPRIVEMLNKPSLEEVRAAFEAVPLPDSVPAISELHWSPSGELWVGDRVSRPGSVGGFHVLSRSGQYVAFVKPEASIARLLDISDDHVAVVHTDEFGVQSVWLLPIVR